MTKRLENKKQFFYDYDFGYRGYIVITYGNLGTDGNFKKKSQLGMREKGDGLYFYGNCYCGYQVLLTFDEVRRKHHAHGDNYDMQVHELLKRYCCPCCGNQSFLPYPKNKLISKIKVEEDEKTIKVYKTELYIGISCNLKPFIKSKLTTGYFISKKNGSIQKAFINPPNTKFKYEAICDTNEFLHDLVLRKISLKVYKEFEILHLTGVNFSLFFGDNAVTTQDELCKRLFKYTYTKSVKREFFKNLNNKDLFVNNNYLIIYKAIGVHFKNPNNVVKLLKATFFLEKLGSYITDMMSEPYEYELQTRELVDILFYTGIKLYGETQFSTNANKLDFDNCVYGDLNMYLRDFTMSLRNFSKKEVCKIIKDKSIPKISKPFNIFKGLHDFMIIYNDFNSSNTHISFIDIYSENLYKKIKKINHLTSHMNIRFELPINSKELKIYELKLRNCISSYAYGILEKNFVIIGIYSNNKLFACAELRGDKIYQLRTNDNFLLHEKDFEILERYFKKINIIISNK